MSFPLFCFLFLLPSLFFPSFALPLALDGPPQVFVGGGNLSAGTKSGNINIPASAAAIAAETDIWPTGAPASLTSLDSPVSFLPSRPPDGFPKPHDRPSSVEPLIMAYYPSWVSAVFPPQRIDFSRFDWIDFAFAIPNNSSALDWDGSDEAPALLSNLVDVAHREGTRVKLSIGGWDGSKWFSGDVKTDLNRQSFAKSIADLYSRYHLDGIDIDWEYPGQHPLDYVDPGDTANFLEFLKLLRRTLPPTARITAAVKTTTFVGADGQPMNDLRDFADVLDWVLLMNYDTWEASPNPGPNAPLADGCKNSTLPEANADAAIKAWINAGFRSSQLVLGVPSYGVISNSDATSLHQRDQPAPSPYVRAVTDEGADSGPVKFRELVNQRVLCKDPTARPSAYVGCNGFTREWDTCSSTPFLHSEAEVQVIPYDDEESLYLKATYARERGLLGVDIFDVQGDTDQWDLVDALRRGLLGLPA